MMQRYVPGLLFAIVLLVMGQLSSAHVVLISKTAEAGSQFEAVFNVGHGCSGSPTVKVRIQIPDGVVDVMPQAKDGWKITQELRRFDHPVSSNGQTFSDGAREVSWSGMLSAHKPDVFTFKARLSTDLASGKKIAFPVIQQCEKGEERWIDSDDEDQHPAPFLTIVPKH